MLTHSPAVRHVLVAIGWLAMVNLLPIAPLHAAETSPDVVKTDRQVPSPSQAFAGVPSLEDLDPNTFAEWEGGQEILIGNHRRERAPQWVEWTSDPRLELGHSGLYYGQSDKPGPRHLRMGFKQPLPVGSVIVNSGGALSVLKPDVPYPGDLADESQWMAAQRLLPSGELSDAPAARDEYALWVLPPDTVTQALRFTTVSAPTDRKYEGWLGASLVTSERLINEAPYATLASRSNSLKAHKLINEQHDGWGAWENREVSRNPATVANLPIISAENAEWILMTWNRSVELDGLTLLWAGLSAMEVQTYTGPADRHPRDAFDGDWTTIQTYTGIRHGYPRQLWPNRLDFDHSVTTRALRLRIIAASPEAGVHPHLRNNMVGGRRVWMGEIWALKSIDNQPLQSINIPVVQRELPKPPIPVKFTLKEPGYVTLVIERPDGVRVRNLISETWFPAGANTAWWDGTDDLGRDIDAAKHGIYRIPARFVAPGEYRVRGLVRGEIDPIYEFSVYTTGTPPWSTDDHTGGWLANHSAPQAAAFVPATKSPTGEPAMFLGSYVTEGPDGMAWVDLDGKKRGGKKWIGGNWTAAPYIATDIGLQAVPGVSAYVGATWETAKKPKDIELRITALMSDRSADKPVLVTRLADLPPPPEDSVVAGNRSVENIGGLAVHNGLAVVSLPPRNQLVLIDVTTGEPVGQITLNQPRGLAFDVAGRLLALSGNTLVRFASLGNPSRVAPPVTLVDSDLENPVAITLDASGQLYVSDRGTSHQIKVFPPDGGGLVRAIGQPGKPQAGPYDPLHMNNPAGIAIDSKDQLWVTETDYLPKRVSVWGLDGRLINAFYGPGKYGGGGTLDSTDDTKFYYADEQHGAMEFKLDWQTGTYALTNVYYRNEPDTMPLAFRSAAPETAIHFQNRRYFTNSYNSNPTGGHGSAFLFLERDDGVARPVASMGRANHWDLLKTDPFKPRWPEGADLVKDEYHRNPVFYLWNDLNGDGHAQPEEVTMFKSSSGGVTVLDDLSFCIARLDGKTTRFAPVTIDANGLPRYDQAHSEILASGAQAPASSGGDQALMTDDGWTAVTLGIEPFSRYSLSGAKDGAAKWSYPSPWPGLHASHESPPPDHPGQLIGTTRLLGGLMHSRIGPLWAVNSNQGCIYVFTADGLFVATVFKDTRNGKHWRMPFAQRGMSLKGFSLNDENFWPSITQLPDGTVYLVDGGRSSLVRLDGLNNLTRLPDSTLKITSQDLDRSRAYQIALEATRQQKHGSGVLTVLGRLTAPVIDGDLDDWPATNWVDIDKRGVRAYFNSNSKPYNVTGSVTVAGGKLYAAWNTGDPKLLQNSGEVPLAPFKTGGALDLMIGANPNAKPDRTAPVAGDVRLLVTVVNKKPLALLYRAVVPGTPEKARVPFSSPWRTVSFDRVDDISDQIEFAAGKDGGYELAVPLDLLLLKPSADMRIKGDIGILRGEGNNTVARIYWANKATGITADVPSEAMLTPSLWGTWQFKPE